MIVFLRTLFRFSLLCLHLILGLLLAFIFLTKPLKRFNLYRPKALIRKWLFVTGYIAGCRIQSNIQAINKPTLLLSNHISWMDILVLGGLYELNFLSKDEVKKWPIIGFLTVISGTLLIKRGQGSQQANQAIQASLNDGCNVGLFPEGTTSNGLATKHFHSRLLKAAYQSSSSITLVSLSYSSNGQTRDAELGWTQQSFLKHVLYVLGAKHSLVKINVVKELNDFKDLPRKELAKLCREAIDQDLQSNHYPCEQ